MTFDPQESGADIGTAGSGSLIHHYEEIAGASRRMLEAAHRGDWAAVEAIEQRCRDMIADLKQAARTAGLSAAEKRRRLSLLRAILADDAQVRLRAEPWLRDLEDFLAAAATSARRSTP